MEKLNVKKEVKVVYKVLLGEKYYDLSGVLELIEELLNGVDMTIDKNLTNYFKGHDFVVSSCSSYNSIKLNEANRDKFNKFYDMLVEILEKKD